MKRAAEIKRTTSETDIFIKINLYIIKYSDVFLFFPT